MNADALGHLLTKDGLKSHGVTRRSAKLAPANGAILAPLLVTLNGKKKMKAILVSTLFFLAMPAMAQVTCKDNVMTTNRFCSSKAVHAGNNYYFLATNDTGTKAHVLFSFGGLISSSRPDGVMVKLDSGIPFKISAVHSRPDVNCRRYGCVWQVAAIATPSNEDFERIGAASKMLVSFTEGSYVSDPIEVDPRKISEWVSEWHSISGGTSMPTPTARPTSTEQPQPQTQLDPAKRCDSCESTGGDL